MGNRKKRELIRALDLTYQKVCNELFAQMNAYPFMRRLVLAGWLVLGRLPKT